jgi:hypothetical protein
MGMLSKEYKAIQTCYNSLIATTPLSNINCDCVDFWNTTLQKLWRKILKM